MVLMVGVDVHKDTHTAVITNELGRRLASTTVHATEAGHLKLLTWADEHTEPSGEQHRWAIEDCRHVSTRLERALLDARQQVLRVPPKLMAGARNTARTFGKSDPIDALAIARAALREPDLPVAYHDQDTFELKQLVDHRDTQVAERTRAINRLRWRLVRLDPDLERRLPRGGLDKPTRLAWLKTHLSEASYGPHTAIDVELSIELVADITTRTHRERDLARRIDKRVQALAPQLLELDGCGPLTAAKLLAETANPDRFRSEACYAMHAGVAPIPASSGRTDRHRLARGGNRKLNHALHTIATSQARRPGTLGHAYLARRTHGNPHAKKDAIRALKRQLARTVFNLLQQTTTPSTTNAA